MTRQRVVLLLFVAAAVSVCSLLYADGSKLMQALQSNPAPASDHDNKPTDVAGVRGLEDSGETVNTQLRDYPAIDRLDKAVVIHPEEMKQFLHDGDLK